MLDPQHSKTEYRRQQFTVPVPVPYRTSTVDWSAKKVSAYLYAYLYTIFRIIRGIETNTVRNCRTSFQWLTNCLRSVLRQADPQRLELARATTASLESMEWSYLWHRLIILRALHLRLVPFSAAVATSGFIVCL